MCKSDVTNVCRTNICDTKINTYATSSRTCLLKRKVNGDFPPQVPFLIRQAACRFISPSGNQTSNSSMTSGDTYHYTTEDSLMCVMS